MSRCSRGRARTGQTVVWCPCYSRERRAWIRAEGRERREPTLFIPGGSRVTAASCPLRTPNAGAASATTVGCRIDTGPGPATTRRYSMRAPAAVPVWHGNHQSHPPVGGGHHGITTASPPSVPYPGASELAGLNGRQPLPPLTDVLFRRRHRDRRLSFGIEHSTPGRALSSPLSTVEEYGANQPTAANIRGRGAGADAGHRPEFLLTDGRAVRPSNAASTHGGGT
jgi:hypothetical protein